MNTSMGGDSEIPEAGPQFAEFFSRKPGRGSLGNFLTIDRRIAASPCSTWAGRPGLGSASLSATTTWWRRRVRTRTLSPTSANSTTKRCCS